LALVMARSRLSAWDRCCPLVSPGSRPRHAPGAVQLGILIRLRQPPSPRRRPHAVRARLSPASTRLLESLELGRGRGPMLDSLRGSLPGSRPCLLATGPSVQPSSDRLGRGRGAGWGRWSSGVYGHGAGRLGAALGDPAVGEAAGATPQRDGQAQVAAGQGGCLCGGPGMAERTPDRVVPVLGKPAVAVALALEAGSCGPGPAPPPCARLKGLATRGHRRSSRLLRRQTVAPQPPVDRDMRRT
jgi:hypothetical protein